jgi:hypothetical protein
VIVAIEMNVKSALLQSPHIFSSVNHQSTVADVHCNARAQRAAVNILTRTADEATSNTGSKPAY